MFDMHKYFLFIEQIRLDEAAKKTKFSVTLTLNQNTKYRQDPYDQQKSTHFSHELRWKQF